MDAYVELHVRSNFSFLDGASHPDELITQAAALGHGAIALTDRNTLAGIVRAHAAAEAAGIRLIPAVQLDLEDHLSLLCYPTDLEDYGNLCQLITLGRRRAEKGACQLFLADVLAHDRQHLYALVPPVALTQLAAQRNLEAALAPLAGRWQGRLWLAAQHLYRGDDRRRLSILSNFAARHGVPLLATNAVTLHSPVRKRLADVVACIREGVTLTAAGALIAANAERHLKSPAEMARLFAPWPQALAETQRLAARCRFSLDQIRYQYPSEVQGEAGETAQQRLERLTWEGAARRYPDGVPEAVRATLTKELGLIAELNYAPYFLTVEDIVRFARSRGILCQGRGSAANSAVCFVLGVTAVDPAQMDLLFARFISAERKEPPDIDIDFEHERREEVIQYVYEKYGRHRAGMTATVIRYRSRGAIRDVGKVMGLSVDLIERMNSTVWGSWGTLYREHIAAEGIDLADPLIAETLDLAEEVMGFPRHLSQHTGGMVMCETRLDRLVPIQNASMADRTVIEWDKDDLDVLGLIKVDILGLGMLSALRRGLHFLQRHYGRRHDLATLPPEDPAVYAMLCRADSVGVFQVESRAQMTMLPRLRPQCFYDLVVEVAIVRPGPIQGEMVHPYLRRRQGKEPVVYPSEDLRRVLSKTMGVPLFQEQVMKIAIVAAGFSDSEADQLRRAMATFRKVGTIGGFQQKMIQGMIDRGYDQDFAERVFKQVQGFGEYGFPESHAASFALLVYASAWMKCHYPDVFCAALLNAQPLGFYAPQQLVRDAREHGVEVRAADINHSLWDCTLEPGTAARRAVRLGLRQIKGLREEEAARLVAARGSGYRSPADMQQRAGVRLDTLTRLAEADAFASLGLDRRQAGWAVRGLEDQPSLPLLHPADEARAARTLAEADQAPLPGLSEGEQVVADYLRTGISLRTHPLALLRSGFAAEGVVACATLGQTPSGRMVSCAGLVLTRQRPGSARGTMFLTLEDESGVANVVVFPTMGEQFRREVMTARLLRVRGRVENSDGVIHLIAAEIIDATDRLALLTDGPTDAARAVPEPRSFR